MTEQPPFVNAAVSLRTRLPPRALLDGLLAIERSRGRVRDGTRWGPRVLDLDILLYGGRSLHEDGLHIPHPRMLQRAFVLVPLSEIAPDRMFDGQTILARAATADTAGIEQLPSGRGWWQA